MNKRFISAAMSAVLGLSLFGCSSAPHAAENEPEILLPEPPDEAINMILGEQIASKPVNVALNYVSGDGTSFSTVTRSLVISPGESVFEEAVDMLLQGASAPDRMAFVPAGIQAQDTDYACGIV